jgi:DNA-directed RNA polymerase subunit omega
MLYPSIDDLKKKLDSKYTLVAVASKRARELRETSAPLVNAPRSYKHVGVALEEIVSEMIDYIKPQGDQKNDSYLKK